jgi:hypothetical protein
MSVGTVDTLSALQDNIYKNKNNRAIASFFQQKQQTERSERRVTPS